MTQETSEQKYKRKLAELTRAYGEYRNKTDMKIYFLEEKIKDFERLCKNNNIDYSLIDKLDSKRRG